MNLFTICTPKEDVLAGKFTDNQYAADLTQVLTGTAPDDYKNPNRFFSNTYPTLGLKKILSSVGRRLSGSGQQVGAIFRLDTQFGGGKTHSLIALVHAMTRPSEIPNLNEFVPIEDIPQELVRIFAFTGENSNPIDGLPTNDPDIRPKSLWGEMAYSLGGREAYELLRKSDENHIAPGAAILERILPKTPVLILIDEIANYLRKIERAFQGASNQFTSFLQELIKTVSTSEKTALVFTLAIDKDKKAVDAYSKEQEFVNKTFEEIQSVVARTVTILNPTDESETKKVIRRRLFSTIQEDKIDPVLQSYRAVLEKYKEQLPSGFSISEFLQNFRESYPFHPSLFTMLTEKLSSLDKFQRTRGMLRLLARTVHQLWEEKPKDVYAIHSHHIHIGISSIRDEVTSRLDMAHYTPALKADVSAVENDTFSVAQNLDKELFYSEFPLTEYVARTIFLYSMAFPETAKGISTPEIRESVLYPGLDISLLEKARTKFIENSQYLDDTPGLHLKFLANPNLEQVIRKQMREFDRIAVYSYYVARIEHIFNGSTFRLLFQPSGPYSLPDDFGDGKPYLIVFSPAQLLVEERQSTLPDLIEKIFRYKGNEQLPREFKNNMVFLAAQENSIEQVESNARRKLALENLRKKEYLKQFPNHQQNKIEEDHKNSDFTLATSIAEAYCHLYFPSMGRTNSFPVDIKHVVIEKPASANRPGDGQYQVKETLKKENKIQEDGSAGDSPLSFVSKVMGGRDRLSTMDVRSEFRKKPSLSITLTDSPILEMIQRGIRDEIFLYSIGEQYWGKGDPTPNVQISDNSFLIKMSYAKEVGMWPRPAPIEVSIRVVENPEPGVYHLLISVDGGIPPYTYSSENIPELNFAEPTSQTATRVSVAIESSTTFTVTVTDSKNKQQQASRFVDLGKVANLSTPTTNIPIAPLQTRFATEGPLSMALETLWKQLRDAKAKKISSLCIKVYDMGVVYKIYQGSINVQASKKRVVYNAASSAPPLVTSFSVQYEGELNKFSAFRNFFEQQCKALLGEEVSIESEFYFEFSPYLSLGDTSPETFSREMCSYGGAEVYVEAEVKE